MSMLRSLLVAVFLSVISATIYAAATIDINTADAAAIDKAMKGVGAKTAAAIVEYRTKHGPFKTVDELTKVKGVSAKTVEKNRNVVTVGDPGR
jgi:competence protein ComEA